MENRRKQTVPTRLTYTAPGVQGNIQTSLPVSISRRNEATSALASGAQGAHGSHDLAGAAGVTRKSTSTHSSISSRSRQVELDTKQKIMDSNREFNRMRNQLQDQIEDLQTQIVQVTDDNTIYKLQAEADELQKKIKRLDRDHKLELQHFQEVEALEKERILAEIEEDQELGLDDEQNHDPVPENWSGHFVPVNNDDYQDGDERGVLPFHSDNNELDNGYNSHSAYQDQSHHQVFTRRGATAIPPQRQQGSSAPQDKDSLLVELLRNQLNIMNRPATMKEWEPKDLPIFNGRAEDWPIFRNEFYRTTPQGKVNSSQNAIRLRKALTGIARDAVIGLLNDPGNITRILRILEESFGRNELVIRALIDKAEQCKTPEFHKPETFVTYGRTVQHLIETVKSLNEDCYLNDMSLLDKLVNKLPVQYSFEWLTWLQGQPTKKKNLAAFGDWIDGKLVLAVQLVKPVVKEDDNQNSPRRTRQRGSASVYVASTETISSKPENDRCSFCDKSNHKIIKCFQFKKASIQDRLKAVREKGLCFRCLESGHSKRDCTSSIICDKADCKMQHHPLIHSNGRLPEKNTEPPATQGEPTNEQPPAQGSSIGAVKSVSSKPMSVVRVRVKGPMGTQRVYALLDSGSDSTAIDEKLTKELGITGSKISHTCTGVGAIKLRNEAQLVNFQVAGNFKSAKFYDVKGVFTMPNIGMGAYSQDAKAVKEKWSFLHRARLESFFNVKIKLIIGEDHPHLSAHRDILERNFDEPMAKMTLLGWVLGGKKIGGSSSSHIHALQLDEDEKLDAILKESFSLDSFGVFPVANKGSVEDQRALKILQDTVKKTGSRWECGLLWRDKDIKFPDSRPEAVARLISNERRMKRDSAYSDLYHAKLEEYLQKEYITELSEQEAQVKTDKTLYIPHFGVFNVNKPGKLRLVFDAACKNGGVSLNDHLLIGPDLIRPLPSVLFNFRIHNIAITGDMEDMYHRVALKSEDIDSQRFLFRSWNKGEDNPPIKTYIMNVLMFGACSSQSSAIYVKDRNAEEYEDQFPEAVAAIKDDFYSDDCLSGAKTIDEAIQLRKQICEINVAGNFFVKKWLSNSKEVLLSIPEEDRAAGVKDFMNKDGIPIERVLGLWWNPEEDCFTFTTNFKKVDPTLLEGRRPTKREMSRLLGSVFDPLGFISNFKVKGTILLQRVWRSGVDWDDEVTDAVFEDWKLWVESLKKTVNVKVPRVYTYDIHLATSVQLHTLVDASEQACSCISFLRVKIGNSIRVAFVCAKTKVAPSSKQTIPRLELIAAVMGAIMADKIVQELRISINKRTFWSDSRTVLSWIRSESLRYKEFVANRVSKIHLLTSSSEWRWIPTALNVADEGTRLEHEIELTPDSLWLSGPLFLLEEPEKWPVECAPKKKIEDDEEVRQSKVFLNTSGDLFGVSVSSDEACGLNRGGNGITVRLEKFSSFTRRVRAQAGFLAAARFWIRKHRKEDASAPWSIVTNSQRMSHIATSDLDTAEKHLAAVVQREVFHDDLLAISSGKFSKSSRLWKLSPFLDNGIIRLGGRIGNADISSDMKYPIILPARHHFTELLILHEHVKNGHQGQATVLNNLRSKYWILEGRAAVRRVIGTCLVCKLDKVKPLVPKMGDLPYYRLSSGNSPFTFTGADLFGPLEVTVGRHREKRWVCVFTCMVTRAIHLEVVYALSTDETMMALSMFIDQRGRPRHLYTDNGTNFVGARKELRQNWETVYWTAIKQSGKFHEVEWHFTPPYSPHFGGAWERMVQSVKKILKKTLHEKHPRDQTLLTMLKGAESIVNSRPLTYVSGDATDPESLTPNHFLRGFSDCGPNIPGSYEEADEVLRAQWRKSQLFMDQFWQRWTKEVLPEMARRQKWHEDVEPLGVGDLVFIVDDNQPRNMWSRGFISATYPGKDGQVRVVEVTTVDPNTKKKTTYKRGVDKLCPLGLKMGKSGNCP